MVDKNKKKVAIEIDEVFADLIPPNREPFHWRTSISYKTPDRIVIRGYHVNELAGNISIAEMLHLVWMGELPNASVAKMLDSIMVIFMEHTFSPSSVSARMVMSGAGYIIPALAGALLSIGYTHVDAHEAADCFRKTVKLMKEKEWTHAQAADWLLSQIRSKEKSVEFLRLLGERKVIPGWHQPQHLKDLRSPRIIELAEVLGVAGDHVKLVVQIEKATERYWGRTIYMNIAGAIAAVLSDLGFSPDLVIALCALARTIGCAAHIHEEQELETGWRASMRSSIVQPLDLALQKPEISYLGPPDRKLPKERIAYPLTREPYWFADPEEWQQLVKDK